jgi:antitoxin component YwqK of YwqJK toxin-antitoxin module
MHNNQPPTEQKIPWIGGVYKGELLDGVPHGLGRLILPTGAKYEGSWQNGKPHGRGTVYYPGGGIYEGEIKEGRRDGYGHYRGSDGKNLNGLWLNGKFIKSLDELRRGDLQATGKQAKRIIQIESLYFTYRNGKGIFDLNFQVNR